MSATLTLLRSRGARWALTLCALVGLLLVFPPFRVVPLGAARANLDAEAFDAAAFANKLWEGELRKRAEAAVDVAELLAALREDPAQASKRWGHRLGLGGSCSFLVSGRGRVISVEDGAVRLGLAGEEAAMVVIETGPVFGNAIRDGSGLVDVSHFANAQQFNAISSEFNRRVEADVLPALTAGAKVGAEVRFAGGVEINDADRPPKQLMVVPLFVELP